MEIKICKLQDSNITCEQVAELIRRAHSANIEKNLLYGTRSTTVTDIEKILNQDNREVFIATLESKLVGTSTVSIVDCNKWFHKGSAAYIELAGVDANYKGHHIFQSILDEQFRYIDGKGVDLIFTVSAEQNAAVKNTFMKKGFKKVAYGAGKSNNFYSVYYARWERSVHIVMPTLHFVISLIRSHMSYISKRAGREEYENRWRIR